MADYLSQQVFSENLRHWMEVRNKSQIDIVRDLKLNQSTVSSWIVGTHIPRMNKIQLLADYFQISKSDLIEDGTNNEKAATTLYTSTDFTLSSSTRRLKPGAEQFIAQMLEVLTENIES